MSKLFEQAKEYFDRIPDGHKNAIQRPWNRSVDRSLRSMIERANNNGDCHYKRRRRHLQAGSRRSGGRERAERISQQRAPSGKINPVKTALHEENI